MRIKAKYLIIFFSLFFSFNSFSQNYFYEDFEGGSIPNGWKEISDEYNLDWRVEEGGHDGNPTSYAPEGTYNAIFQHQTTSGAKTKLVTPVIDLEFAIKPELIFWHAQDIWYHGGTPYHDELTVYYKNNIDTNWIQLEQYENAVETWQLRNIQIPDSAKTDSVFIAFEGLANWGHGVLLDSIRIEANDTIPKYVKSVNTTQVSNEVIASGSSNNPILKTDIVIEGNEGAMILDSIGYTSKNSNDDDIAVNGCKLFYSETESFDSRIKVAETTPSNGVIFFNNLNTDLPTGENFLWLTFDLKNDQLIQRQGNTLDASLSANSIKISDTTIINQAHDPSGHGIFYETIFHDDFDTDKGWEFSNVGEFERAIPQGLGGSDGGGSSDPDSAFIGDKIIGNDLTGLGTSAGNYEPNIKSRGDSAVSPNFNLYFYKDVILKFHRQLNVEYGNDTATLDLTTNNGKSWKTIWQESVSELRWNEVFYDLSQFDIDFKDSVKIRFSIGPTDNNTNYSGWNIDNFYILGNFIDSDVGVTEWLAPKDGCGHTSEDSVTIRVKNYAGLPTSENIIVKYSVDGGITEYTDTIKNSIPSDEDTVFTFKPKVDLSEPGFYENAYATTVNSNDENHSNDTLFNKIYAAPTYNLPYENDFEDEVKFWITKGKNPSWELGEPNGSSIDTAYSGNNAWMTGLQDIYNDNDTSYVEGPCFDLSKIDHPIIDLYLSGDPDELNDDGIALEYSLDNGNSWQLIDTTNNNLGFKWYNNSNINALGHAGWDTVTNGWVNYKCLLTTPLSSHSSVKFRFKFASDSDNNTDDGFAFDDFKIFNAPPDVGLDTILYPNKHCMLTENEHIEVSVRNYGIDTVHAGDSIKVAYNFNNQGAVFDTLILSNDLPVDSSTHFTFNPTVDLSSEGTYSIKAYTAFDKEIPDFYNQPNNDTATKQVTIYGYPTADLGPDIRTVEPDTLTLSTPEDPDYNYSWEGATGTPTGNEYSDLTVSDKDTVIVTVTNSITGCVSKDSVSILRLKPDIGVDSIISPVSDCEIGAETYVHARVKNFGTDTLFVNDSVVLGAIADGNSVKDTFLMTERVNPGETFTHEFNKALDMSTLDMTYNIRVYSELVPSSYDVDGTNDTATKSVTSYGYPNFTLDVDTTVEALSYQINAQTGFDNYNWEYGSENSPNFTVTDSLYQTTGDEYYEVTVTDTNGCSTTDSAHVKLWIHDMTVAHKLTPVSDCELSENTTVEISVKNNGTDTLFTGEDLHFGYNLDGSVIQKDTLQLTGNLYPGDTLAHVFDSTADMSSYKAYTFDFYTMQTNDMRTGNDTLENTTHAWGYPQIALGPDTAVAALSYTLDPGEFEQYTWHNGYEGRYFVVKDDSTETDNNYYTVTVTDSLGCSSTDSVKINLSVTDLKPVALIRPEPACHMNNAVSVEISFKNLSDYSFEAGKEIPLGYSVEGKEASETMTLDEELPTEGTAEYTFNKKVQISGEGMHTFKFFVAYQGDLVPSNDTLTHDVEIYGDADVDLGADTLFTEENEYLLSAGREFDSYEWQDGTTMRTYLVESSGQYSVNVIDTLGCSGSDTIQIFLDSTQTTGVNPIASEDYKILIYPNPVRNRLTVDIDAGMPQQFRLMLYNNQGQMVYSDQITTRRRKYRINTREFPEGVYFMRIQTKGNIHSKQIVVQ